MWSALMPDGGGLSTAHLQGPITESLLLPTFESTTPVRFFLGFNPGARVSGSNFTYLLCLSARHVRRDVSPALSTSACSRIDVFLIRCLKTCIGDRLFCFITPGRRIKNEMRKREPEKKMVDWEGSTVKWRTRRMSFGQRRLQARDSLIFFSFFFCKGEGWLVWIVAWRLCSGCGTIMNYFAGSFWAQNRR